MKAEKKEAINKELRHKHMNGLVMEPLPLWLANPPPTDITIAYLLMGHVKILQLQMMMKKLSCHVSFVSLVDLTILAVQGYPLLNTENAPPLNNFFFLLRINS